MVGTKNQEETFSLLQNGSNHFICGVMAHGYNNLENAPRPSGQETSRNTFLPASSHMPCSMAQRHTRVSHRSRVDTSLHSLCTLESFQENIGNKHCKSDAHHVLRFSVPLFHNSRRTFAVNSSHFDQASVPLAQVLLLIRAKFAPFFHCAHNFHTIIIFADWVGFIKVVATVKSVTESAAVKQFEVVAFFLMTCQISFAADCALPCLKSRLASLDQNAFVREFFLSLALDAESLHFGTDFHIPL